MISDQARLAEVVRLIAFYLPQYHPIPENDAWWGKGFTEWTNVSKTRPLFRGHEQPHVPAELGYYDLRQPAVQQAQADLATAYGLHGFCYYHYWFNGKRLLHQPLDTALTTGKPALPFCLCWANENWTRAWDGHEKHVLLAQDYSHNDDLDHIRWLAGVFQDPRYIRVDGKPLFLVYRASRLPNAAATARLWREEARRLLGTDIFLCRVESFASEYGDPASIGFDAAVEFQPRWSDLGAPLQRGPLWGAARRLGLASFAYAAHNVLDYGELVARMEALPDPDYLRFSCVTPRWDNSPRRQTGATIFIKSTPDRYERWLATALKKSLARGRKLVFLNAWNEWGEGNHLEPCQRWGRAYLEATRQAVKNCTPSQARPG